MLRGTDKRRESGFGGREGGGGGGEVDEGGDRKLI